ncbi:hypothetical protein P171DRAFT_213153 [Karstenula rhodostoma CBS 690.94]|uniref:Uncharacterized protein n=1 Tax=Karstenula rhodostoma CBS 690.94 TaxID=1392251 RepID=A0A9P4PT44_9PLEO|nr:hypothetical protein P171DRAFT_213153 [Karstenula rhodostoma CBS 690.94]
MMPGAGLYLPDTLSKSLDRTEAHTVRQRQVDCSSSQDSDSDRKSIALSRMSSENVTKVFSTLPTVFDFADWLSTQRRLSSTNEVFVDLLQRVRHDVTEASRLYTSQAVVDYLESWPDKKAYIDKILHDIKKVLNDIGQFLETVRVSGEDGGTVGLRRKFQWALSHQKKLTSKQQLLTTCHQSLMPAVQLMQTAEMNVTFDPIHELPAQPWVGHTTSDILKSPHSRQKWRFNQRNSSVPSITLSEPDLKDGRIVRPYQHALAELPGSTPDDLHRPSLDVHAELPNSRSNSMESQESHRPTTANASMATAPRRRPPDPPPTRKSIDHVRPSLSFFDDRARASFDSARFRAYSEQMRPQRSFEMRSRPSFDQVQPLPTLTERPIERFNSTASVAVGDAISVPLTPLINQTRCINVRKLPAKHSSLPSTLPSSPDQTLMDDLSTWVIPQSVRESYRSVQSLDTTPSISESTPATSVASSPVVPNPLASCPPAPLNATQDPPLPLSEAAMETKLERISTEPSPILRSIPIVPSRPAPALPTPSPPPPTSPKIPLSGHHEPDVMPQSSSNQSPKRNIPPIPYTRSNESLQRAPSDPIPPPFVRRRRPVPSSNKNGPKQDTSEGPSTSNTSPIGTASKSVHPQHAATPNVTEQSETASQVQRSSSDVHSSTGPESFYELKQSIQHAASNATTTDKYPIPMIPSDPPPTPDLPRLPPQQTSGSTSSATSRSQSDIHPTFSNASATDKYPIAVSPTGQPPIPSFPLASPPTNITSSEAPNSGTYVAQPSSRPMTALAKRRAAHAKRMHMAFGPDSANT